MGREGYSYDFTADDSGFQRTIKRMKDSVSGFINSAQSMWRGFDFESDYSSVEELTELVKNQTRYVSQLEKEWEALDDKISMGNGTSADLQNWELKGERLQQAKHRLSEYRKELEKAQNQEGQGKGNNYFKGLLKDIKKFGFALIGVRSAFMRFRKIYNTALSQNAELANKFNAIWTALANALTPVLERVVNVLLTAFTYLNMFLKALSGGKIDLLANTSKSAKSTASSMKEANKQLAGFDELNNIDTGSGGGGAGGLGFADAFKDINIDTKWADRIQAFGEWCKANMPAVIGFIAGMALAFSKVFREFTLIEKIGIVLIFTGLFEIIKGISDFIGGVFNGDLHLVVQGLGEITVGIGLVIAGFTLLTGTFTLGIGAIVAGIVALGVRIIKNKDEIAEKLRAFIERAKVKWGEFKQRFVDKIHEMVQNFKDGCQKWDEWWSNFKEKFVKGASTMAEKFKGIVADIKENWKTYFINGLIGFVEGFANAVLKANNFIVRALNKIHFTIPDWVPLIGGNSFGFNLTEQPLVSIPRLDTGTNYVPNDQLAMLHKGEAVIPKKFNSDEYFANEETNELLQILIDKVDGLEINPYITVKDVGEASVKYQNQQYRLRGRALVNG